MYTTIVPGRRRISILRWAAAEHVNSWMSCRKTPSSPIQWKARTKTAAVDAVGHEFEEWMGPRVEKKVYGRIERGAVVFRGEWRETRGRRCPTIATLSTFGGSWKRARSPKTGRRGGGERGAGGCSMVGVRRPYPRNIRTILRKIGSRADSSRVRVIGEAEGWSRRRNSVELPYRASNWIKPISRMGRWGEGGSGERGFK